MALQQLLQAGVGLTAGDDLLPVADEEFDRREGAAEQDGGRDHHPGGDLVLEHEQRAEAEDQRLHGDAHEFGCAAQHRRAVACQRLGVDLLAVEGVPALADGGQHAHRLDDFAVAQMADECLVGLHGELLCLVQAGLGEAFVRHREHEQHDRASEREPAEQWRHHEDHHEVDRQPGRVEGGEQGASR
jgi:hypothetical protein